MMVLGNRVKGGLASQPSDLNNLDRQRRPARLDRLPARLQGDLPGVVPDEPGVLPARPPGRRDQPLRRHAHAPQGGVTSRRIRLAVAGAAFLAAPAAVLPLAADARSHRTHQPPPNVKLWRSMAVNETEWAVRPGHLNFAAGTVRIHVYNQGMDDHDLTIADAAGHIVASRGVLAKNGSKAGEAVFTVKPEAGPLPRVLLLFAGTSRLPRGARHEGGDPRVLSRGCTARPWRAEEHASRIAGARHAARAARRTSACLVGSLPSPLRVDAASAARSLRYSDPLRRRSAARAWLVAFVVRWHAIRHGPAPMTFWCTGTIRQRQVGRLPPSMRQDQRERFAPGTATAARRHGTARDRTAQRPRRHLPARPQRRTPGHRGARCPGVGSTDQRTVIVSVVVL